MRWKETENPRGRGGAKCPRTAPRLFPLYCAGVADRISGPQPFADSRTVKTAAFVRSSVPDVAPGSLGRPDGTGRNVTQERRLKPNGAKLRFFFFFLHWTE